jgi:hypothetical protein
MSFGTTIRRFNPLKVDLVALGEPPFDPRKQSWGAGALAAVEAFIGGMIALPLLATAAEGVWLLCMSPGQRQAHHFHRVNVWMFYQLGACGFLAAAFLWAGLALMFGWRSRYRAQGVLALVMLLLVGLHSIVLAAIGR